MLRGGEILVLNRKLFINVEKYINFVVRETIYRYFLFYFQSQLVATSSSDRVGSVSGKHTIVNDLNFHKGLLFCLTHAMCYGCLLFMVY